MAIKILPKRGSTASLSQANPQLEKGEIVVDLTANKIKIGDGVSNWNSLPYTGSAGPAGMDGTANLPTGSLAHFPGNSARTGWALADGSQLSISQNPELSATLSTSFSGLTVPDSVTPAVNSPTNKWDVNMAFFSDTAQQYNDGGFLSGDNTTNTSIDLGVCSFSFSSATTLTEFSVHSVYLGSSPVSWNLSTIGYGVLPFITSAQIATSGSRVANAIWEILPANTATTFYLSVQTNSYNTDYGVGRVFMKASQAADPGYALLPSLTAVNGNYPYIKL